MQPPNSLQLRIQLDDITPKIWRRVIAPVDFSLAELHLLIQGAMGWEHKHAHAFSVGDKRYSSPDAETKQTDDLAEEDCLLTDAFKQIGDSVAYEYDFGDSWTHTIALERQLDDECKFPSVTEGQNACPIEDFGGAARYQQLLSGLAEGDLQKRFGAEYKSIIASIPEDFSPLDFDLAEANFLVADAFDLQEGAFVDAVIEADAAEAWDELLSEGFPYDPGQIPDAEAWRNCDEEVLLSAIIAWHMKQFEKAGQVPPDEWVFPHAAAHMLVENQLIEDKDGDTAKKFREFIKAGLDRHETLHAIGTAWMWRLHMAEVKDQLPDDKAFSNVLDALTVENWQSREFHNVLDEKFSS